MGSNDKVDYGRYFRLGFETREQVDDYLENANRKITGHMNDPDAPTSGGVQLPGQSSSYFGYLSDADDKVYTEREWKALHQPPKLGLSSPSAGGGLGAETTTPLGGWTGTATPDYTITPGQPIKNFV